MMGLPALPRKLPSRNWLIFWTLTGTLTATIIYDRREKRKATARWAASVSHLAKEPLPANNASAMPRKLTIYLAAPPGDSLRTAQDHFREYVKPVLAASGLDWEFRQGRQQGDIRAVVAEEVRKRRRRAEGEAEVVDEADLATTEEHIEQWRRQHGIAEYDGVRGDIVIGRHTWKEYLRGLHEGWLGPLRAPPHAQPDPEPEAVVESEEQEKRPKRPAQPKPYNSVEDYATAHLPMTIPDELAPSTPLPFPHILGFLNTPIRTYRFLTRRRLADEIGREVAAACLCTYREYKELDNANSEQKWEQQTALEHEESNWVKEVWKPDEEAAQEKTAEAADDASPTAEGSELVDGSKPQPTTVKKEKIWPKSIVLDPRIAMRMRRFEIQPEDEQRAKNFIVPEEEIEGVIKGSFRSLWRWGAGAFEKKEKIPNVGEVD